MQDTFGNIFNEGTAFQRDGSQFDALFEDGDSYHVGQMQSTVIATPVHTPACMVHVMGDAAFVGHLPTRTDFDARLITGAAIFGVGWGLGGFCPGPAMTALPLAAEGTLIFVATMLTGMAASKYVLQRRDNHV